MVKWTSIYLKVSVSDFLTLFSARTGPNYFWTSKPAPILLGAAVVALSMSTLLACIWPPTYPDGIYAHGLGYVKPYGLAFYIWLYCIFFWFIQDFCKVQFYALMVKYNWFGWNDTGKLVLPQSTLDYIAKNKSADMAASSKVPGHH